MEVGYNEPLSPAGRMYLRREFDASIDSFVQFQNPVDMFAVKVALASLPKTCPRLRSVVIEKRGRPHWKELPSLNVIDHIIIVPEEEEEEDGNTQAYINKYLVSLPSMAAVSRNSPLWEVHILPKRHRALVLRLHHCLGDCVSLLALFLSCCDAPVEDVPISDVRSKKKTNFVAQLVKGGASVWQTLKGVLYTLPYAVAFLRHPYVKREELYLTVRGGLETAPRKMASVTLRLDDLKAVKNKLDATINDVFVGLVSYGISNYLTIVGSEGMENPTVSGMVAVNIRGQGSKEILRSIQKKEKIAWGNKCGLFLLPIRLENKDDPLKFVRTAKGIIDKRKMSFEAIYTWKVCNLIPKLFGIENMAPLTYKFRQNSSMLLSNVVGPSGPIKLGTNLITNIGVTLSCLPGAIDVHLISYNGKAFLQFLVAEDVIPEPELLCLYVEEALTEMIANILNVDDVAC
ncbi:wax ester synthase/diacylglycerol acyltransferase 11-like isoform X2 [Wolffia australiana]